MLRLAENRWATLVYYAAEFRLGQWGRRKVEQVFQAALSFADYVEYIIEQSGFPKLDNSPMDLISPTSGSWIRSLIHECPAAVVAVNHRDQITLWNPAAERLLGHCSADVVGRAWSELVVDAAGESRVFLRHRAGHRRLVVLKPIPGDAPDVGRAFFLEPCDSLLEATQRVVGDVLQHLPAYFSIIDTDFRYLMACRSCEDLFGRPRDQIEGRLVREMFGEDVYAIVRPALEQAHGGQSASGEFSALGADGKTHDLRVHLTPLFASTGEVTGIFSFAYDITELRVTAATLRESESQYRFLVDNNPDLITVIDRDFRLQFINHTEPDPSVRPVDLIGMNVLDLAPPAYRDWMQQQYRTVLETGKSLDIEAPIVWRGGMRWFSSRLVVMPNGDRPPDQIFIVSREVTRRIEAEQKLRESETRFRQFAESLDDVVWIHDILPERVTYANRSFERIWGVSNQELYDDPRRWIASVHPDDRDRVTRAWEDIVECRTTHFDIEYRIVRPDGGVRWLHDSGVAIHDEDGRCVRLSGIAQDVSLRKQAEAEREILHRKLLETQKLESLGVLAGGVAHDFNNLLAGILNNVGLAQLELDLSPNVLARLEQIEIISGRAGELCQQMLAYAGKGRFVIGPFDINDLIDEISHLVTVSISKKAKVERRLAEGLPPIRGDASQLRQVLLNLILNASEAFGDNPGIIRIATGRRTLSAENLTDYPLSPDISAGDYVFLEVADDGPGMSPEVLVRIFEPFFTTKFTGRGLGLAAVQGIARSHRGAIRVDSAPGRGTVFTVLLPPADALEVPPPAAPAPALPMQCFGEVLLVDDEEIIRSTLSLMLESFGFTVHTACNGLEAVDVFRLRHPHLKFVVLDLTMPILSGKESHAEMALINPTVPVIFMSGYMEQELVDVQSQQIAGFLQKPFHVDTLEQLIARISQSETRQMTTAE